jgi:hypothetical protein
MLKRFITSIAILNGVFCLAFTACSNQAADTSQSKTNGTDSSLPAIQSTITSIPDSITSQKQQQVTAYTRAIAEYIKAIYEYDKSRYDTLFFGKHDDFPEIKLPTVIGNTNIILLTPAEADKKRTYHKSMVYINMFGSTDGDRAEFILVTFFPGYHHQYDYFIDLKYDAIRKDFVLEKVRLEKYIYDKEGKPERIAIYKDGKYVGNKSIKNK